MPKIYNGRSKKRYRTPRVMIQSLARGFLGRLEAQRQRDEREIMNFVNYVPEQYNGDPNLQWLRGMAGAGGRPMAAGGGQIHLPNSGSTAVARQALPGYPNMPGRRPLSFRRPSSTGLNIPAQRRRLYKEQKSIWELINRKS